ncbi:hypothetical protein [Lacinutrix mariniflava]|uniref:hypothetical protein n=1 Tax=Lacinutrix mariniflava TaxID=342955 RepID=UPI0013793A54|nr:hypothetical protein [Lacinutrix mariniflava]
MKRIYNTNKPNAYYKLLLLNLNNSHKALAISLLIAGSVILSLFNFSLIKQNEVVAETLIDITPPDLFIEDARKDTEPKDNSQKTNKGYNKTKDYKHFTQAFKPIAPPKDYDDPRLKNISKKISKEKETPKTNGNSKSNTKELSSFKSVSAILNKRKKATQQSSSKASANKNSSIIYSLKGRTDTALPIPIYLCETQGKIVVNITVNAFGEVVSTAINSTSTSSNACLQKNALEFAKEAHFDVSKKTSQVGTITFTFEGK